MFSIFRLNCQGQTGSHLHGSLLSTGSCGQSPLHQATGASCQNQSLKWTLDSLNHRQKVLNYQWPVVCGNVKRTNEFEFLSTNSYLQKAKLKSKLLYIIITIHHPFLFFFYSMMNSPHVVARIQSAPRLASNHTIFARIFSVEGCKGRINSMPQNINKPTNLDVNIVLDIQAQLFADVIASSDSLELFLLRFLTWHLNKSITGHKNIII